MDRTRDNSSIATSSYSVLETHSTIGTVTQLSGVHSVVQTDVMQDHVTPGFRKLSRAGAFIISPMVKRKRVCEYNANAYIFITAAKPGSPVSTWSETGVYQPSRHTASSYDAMVDPAVLTLVGRLEGEAVTEAYAGVNLAGVETLTELVELRETLAFLYNPVSKMVKLTLRAASWLRYAERVYSQWQKRLRRWEKLPPHRRIGRNHNPPELPKLRPIVIGRFKVTDIPSFWLAMRYGLMPLVYSFQDVQQTFFEKANELVTKPSRATSRKTVSGEVSLSGPTTPTIINYGGGSFKSLYFFEGRVVVSARAGVTYVPDWSLNAQAGMQISRVPATLWEIIPLSFVADWFWNGSKVYDALTADFRALKILGSWCTTTVEYTAKSGLALSPVQHTTTSGRVEHVITSGKWKGRKHTSLSDVQFQMKLDLNAKRIADGLSLVYLFLSTGKTSNRR